MSDDDIVCEIPVVLSNQLISTHQMILAQYPLRPRERPYADDQLQLGAARFKPVQQRLQMEMRIKQDGHFNGETLDAGMNSELTLESRTVPMQTNYAVGMLRNGKLFLLPCSAVCQMRPSFEHLNVLDRAAAKQALAAAAAEVPPPKEEEKTEMVITRVRKRRTTYARRLTHQEMCREADAEPWLELAVPAAANERDEEAQRLADAVTANASLVQRDYPVTADALMDAISGTDKTHAVASLPEMLDNADAGSVLLRVRPRKEYSREQFLRLPMEQRVASLLKDAQVLSFAKVKSLCRVRSTSEEKEARLAVEKFGLYLSHASVWAAQSALNYDGRAALVRDFVLTLLDRSSCIDATSVARVARLPQKQLDKILDELCTLLPLETARSLEAAYVPFDDAELESVEEEKDATEEVRRIRPRFVVVKCSGDADFAEAYPETVEAQGRFLHAMRAKLRAELGVTAAVEQAALVSTDGVAAASSVSSSSDEQEDSARRTVTQLKQHLARCFARHHVCSRQLLLRRFQAAQAEVGAQNYLSLATQAQFEEVLEGMASSVEVPRGTLFFQTRLHEALDPARHAVAELFAARMRDAPNGEVALRKADVQAHVKSKCGRKLSTNHYSKIMCELCVTNSKGQWQLRNGMGTGGV